MDPIGNFSEVILHATLTAGTHLHKSNWFVANFRYNLIQGIPWHLDHNQLIDYEKRIVTFGNYVTSSTKEFNKRKTEVKNLSVKKFRSLVAKKRLSFRFSSFMCGLSKKKITLKEIIDAYQNMFEENLLPVMPRVRPVDLKIETDQIGKSPHTFISIFPFVTQSHKGIRGRACEN